MFVFCGGVGFKNKIKANDRWQEIWSQLRKYVLLVDLIVPVKCINVSDVIEGNSLLCVINSGH